MQYEIVHNPHTVDLLVSLAYTAAIEGVLEEPPVGIALRVPSPKAGLIGNHRGAQNATTEPVTSASVQVGKDGLCEFDDLTIPEVGIISLSLP